jgi:predicted RNase H-like HicB family nuclease
MNKRKYRIIIRYDIEKELYVGKVPELPGCEVEGDDWEAVTTLLDEIIEGRLAKIDHPPTPLDEMKWEEKFLLELSTSLRRELTFMAKTDEVTPEQLAQELISEGLGRRYGGHRFYRSSRKGGQSGNNHNHNSHKSRSGRRNVSPDKYQNIMEDKASFMEYVRGLDGNASKRHNYRKPRDE